MNYHSTRGKDRGISFDNVLLTGLARDGGLFLPEQWPTFSKADLITLIGLPYHQLAIRVMEPFLNGTICESDFIDIVTETYAEFDHIAVAPLKQLGNNDWLLELFHGPTLSFKDYALQLLGRLFDYFLIKRCQRVTIVGATSGDTGSASIEACKNRTSINVIIIHPKGRISEVQRRQMTTVIASNIHNIALDGTFDDCQDIVKAMLNDQMFREQLHLSVVNSINWTRIMAQIVYYFAAGLALGAPHVPISFAVPTGNFGNVYAAFVARRMGLPISQLIVGSNSNDILTRFFETGKMSINAVIPTLSPSMDIQISSNFERYLFYLFNEDGKRVLDFMMKFRQERQFEVSEITKTTISNLFQGYRLSDKETIEIMYKLYQETGELIDPHSAIGVAAGRRANRCSKITPMIALATAHAAKFPDVVEVATGVRPILPKRLNDLFNLHEQYEVLPNDLEIVKDYVKQVSEVKI
ncbi:MAG: threonine synthase [Rhodospirillaceae bacterium]|jgi:threonine synthase|nr:threonine synthase [Rhodospirillaceae bacterium]